mmetsp:Transcript_5877/g.9404  ORF Transcript_5877/g.9404 Transcript_5877/m.9404 type:complete len:91 (+) Transcript_5877:90-362(+)
MMRTARITFQASIISATKMATSFRGMFFCSYSDDASWDRIKQLWGKWGVMDWMVEYLPQFFPGREDDAQLIGILDQANSDEMDEKMMELI